MSYEFSSESKRLDLPNPFKIENYFLIFTSAIMVGVAIWLLMLGRTAIAEGNGFNSYLPTIIGILMLVGGLTYCGWALAQLRFFFGRNEPKNIDVINPSMSAKSTGVDMLRETIRQNALTYIEPKGALNGLLYSKIPNLIFAPLPIQLFAQRQFHNMLAIVAITLSLLISWLSLSDEQSIIWVGLFFFVISLAIVTKHLKNRTQQQSELGIKGLVGLVIMAILSPVLLPKLTQSLPSLPFANLTIQTLVLLVLTLIAIVLFFVALIKQMVPPPKTTSACNQQSFSMNCSPVQLVDEADRVLLNNWTEQIPNRSLSHVLPTITHGTMNTVGDFRGEVIEETQPMPNDELRKQTFKSALENPRYKGLIWLDVLGVIITTLGVGYIAYFVKNYNILNFVVQDLGVATFGLGLIALGAFCFKSAHRLWGRFDFVSKITWIEMLGNYQSAKMDYGNVISDRVKTEKQIINVENMTLRVWICEIDSVALSKDESRYITAMRGLNDDATYFANHLIQFAKNQSIIIAPDSQVDQQKIAAMALMNQAQPAAVEQIPSNTINYLATQKGSCAHCSNELAVGAKFCAHCGEKVT